MLSLLHPLRVLKGKHCDVVVCFQLCPARKELEGNISFGKGVFFPMYDALPPLMSTRWYEYQDFRIINFCKKLYKTFSDLGFCSHYIQYFPKPYEKLENSDERTIFFWQRSSDLILQQVEKLFLNYDINHLHLDGAVEPGCTLSSLPEAGSSKTIHSVWFPKKAELLRKIEKSALYVAPRHKTYILGLPFGEIRRCGHNWQWVFPHYKIPILFFTHKFTRKIFKLFGLTLFLSKKNFS